METINMKTLIPNLDLTEQEIAQQTLNFLVRQGKRSYSKKDLACSYRLISDETSLACAVGAWIDDRFTGALRAVCSVQGLICDGTFDVYAGWDKFKDFGYKNLILFTHLQVFHDRMSKWNSFESFKESWESFVQGKYDFTINLNKDDWGIGNA